jgi:excisionase family DNA binding protein
MKKNQRQSRGKSKKPSVTHCQEIPQGVVLYTKPQLAVLLQVSVRSVTNMMGRGEISYLKIGGRLVRFRIDEVNRRLTETVGVCKGKGET